MSLFMALVLGTPSVGALVRGGLPTWLAGFGLVAALGLDVGGGGALPVGR